MPPVPIERVEVKAYTVPTSSPESDGTLEWDRTTLVVVTVVAGGVEGLGYTYADRSTAQFVALHFAPRVHGLDAMAVTGTWELLRRAMRNLGRAGVGAMALSAMDTALWDLKARLLGTSLATLLGPVRAGVPIYGSGGFTSYSVDELQRQLSGWVEAGIPRVKMKVGRDPAADRARVQAAREAIGPAPELFVDANGAYDGRLARAQATVFADQDVRWFEEPVSSNNLEGLRLIRETGPPAMDIAAGEYGYTVGYFRRMLQAGAVDVLQADATRCGGPTGFLRAAAVCAAFERPLSAHTAPSLHASLGCAVANVRHIEYFYDHTRIEGMLFEGTPRPAAGVLSPDFSAAGLGLALRRRDARPFEVYAWSG